jgi:hypothetical protein
MPIVPVTGQLAAPFNAATGYIGDTVTAQPGGDGTVLLSLAGIFTSATVQIEAIPFGQTQYVPVLELRSDTGGVTQNGIVGPVTGAGLGSGLTLTANGGAISSIRIRLLSIGSGAITGGIATAPFPFSSAFTYVTGNVSLSGSVMAQLEAEIRILREPSLGMSLQPQFGPLVLDLANRPSPFDLVPHNQ